MRTFDREVLEQHFDDAAGRQFALGFLATYRRMLDRRVRRVSDAVLAPDPDLKAAMDALLSLAVSSSFAGSLEMAAVAAELRQDLSAGDLQAARARTVGLPAAARRTEEAIDAYLRRVSAP